MVLGNEIDELNELSSQKEFGYLVCVECNGYYELQENESPEDFEGCECGGSLEFRKNIKSANVEFNSSNVDMADSVHHDEYEELQKIITVLKNKAYARKELLENLSNRIIIQEELLNELKEQRWALWDILEEKNLQNDIKGQKTLLQSITEQEDKLLSHIKEQRSRAENIEKKSDIGSFIKIGVLVIVVIIIGLAVLFLVS